VDLLQESFSLLGNSTAETKATSIGEFINVSLDPLGNTALHVAATRASLECLDMLLDQEGVEVDPRNRIQGDTPLHSAARLSAEDGIGEDAEAVITMLLEAGADPRYPVVTVTDLRIRNKGQLKAIDIVPVQNQKLKGILSRAEFAQTAGGDIANGTIVADHTDLDDDDEGGDSASDED
jgi:ankyrin repeat protein